MGHLFLSHSTERAREAEELCRYIEDEGAMCWIAPRDIALGADWGEAILQGTRQADAFVLLLCDASSRSGAQGELARASVLELDALPTPGDCIW